jgi:hypothetical protein
MKNYNFDLTEVNNEKDFWDLYLKVVDGDGSEYFGRNMYAFRDSITGGGPGCPEFPSKFIFTNSNPNSSEVMGKILSILRESDKIQIELKP